MVFHFEEDGAWQFSSDDLKNFEEVARIVGLGEIISLDESVNSPFFLAYCCHTLLVLVVSMVLPA